MARALAMLVVCLAAGGCNFLLDEFTYLDRAAPAPVRPPDAPCPGLDERP